MKAAQTFDGDDAALPNQFCGLPNSVGSGGRGFQVPRRCRYVKLAAIRLPLCKRGVGEIVRINPAHPLYVLRVVFPKGKISSIAWRMRSAAFQGDVWKRYRLAHPPTTTSARKPDSNWPGHESGGPLDRRIRVGNPGTSRTPPCWCWRGRKVRRERWTGAARSGCSWRRGNGSGGCWGRRFRPDNPGKWRRRRRWGGDTVSPAGDDAELGMIGFGQFCAFQRIQLSQRRQFARNLGDKACKASALPKA